MKKFGPSWIFIIPSIVIEVITLFLGIALLFKAKTLGIGFFILVFVPLTFILLFVNYRKIVIHQDKICFHSLFSKKCLSYEKIKNVDLRKIGVRNTLWVEHENGLIITPMVFSKPASLKEAFEEKLGEKVSDENWKYSSLDIALLYLAAIFLVFVVLIRFI